MQKEFPNQGIFVSSFLAWSVPPPLFFYFLSFFPHGCFCALPPYSPSFPPTQMIKWKSLYSSSPPLVTHFFLLYRSYTLLTQSYINWTRKRIPSRMFSFFSFLEEKKIFFFFWWNKSFPCRESFLESFCFLSLLIFYAIDLLIHLYLFFYSLDITSLQ